MKSRSFFGRVTCASRAGERVKMKLEKNGGVKAKAMKYAIDGFSFGMVIVLIAIYRIANAVGNSPDGGRVFLVALLILGVTTGIGYLSGLSKSEVKEMTEFLLSDSQSPVLRFWVDCNQKEAIIQLFKTGGLTPQSVKK